MRIAIVNATRAKLGGVETYLDAIAPALSSAGHAIAMLYEHDVQGPRAEVRLPDDAPVWSVAALGAARAIAAVEAWRPDILYVHKVRDSAFESALFAVAPSVFFVHDYHGTCISGNKTFRRPRAEPCDRRFGLGCLLLYFPRGCGGRSPITMLRLYRLQARRLRLLRRYDAVVTHSEHMLRECLKHDLSAEQTYNFPYYVRPPALLPEASEGAPVPPPPIRRLVFTGRLEFLKGGWMLLDAVAVVAETTGWSIHVVFAGDGRERAAWQRKAAQIQRRHPGVTVEFTGWLEPAQMARVLDTAELLVVPSVWPEPFGLVGPEAGLRGVPTAAFAVGGVRDWLIPGVNGYLAPGDPPTAAGLAEAITRCLADPALHARLRQGASAVAQQFSIANHATALTAVFEKVIQRRRTAAERAVAERR